MRSIGDDHEEDAKEGEATDSKMESTRFFERRLARLRWDFRVCDRTSSPRSSHPRIIPWWASSEGEGVEDGRVWMLRVWRWIVPMADTSALLHSAQPVRRAPMDPTRWPLALRSFAPHN